MEHIADDLQTNEKEKGGLLSKIFDCLTPNFIKEYNEEKLEAAFLKKYPDAFEFIQEKREQKYKQSEEHQQNIAYIARSVISTKEHVDTPEEINKSIKEYLEKNPDDVTVEEINKYIQSMPSDEKESLKNPEMWKRINASKQYEADMQKQYAEEDKNNSVAILEA